MPMPEPLRELIESHPHLDAEELEANFYGMREPDEEDRPQPYDEAERQAHEIVLAYLQHRGTPEFDGSPGERSERSMNTFVEKAGLATVTDGEGSEPAAIVPCEVLLNLLADYVLLANMRAQDNGEGNAQDLLLRIVRSRMAEDAARRAWESAT